MTHFHAINAQRNDHGRAGELCECGDHCFRAINKHFVLLVSPIDADQLNHSWRATVGQAGYVTVAREKGVGPKERQKVVLGREILCPADGLLADHRSGDTLDNRRSNLREATTAESAFNRRGHRDALVPFKGVTMRGKRYMASISKAGRRFYLGTYSAPEQAHAAYCEAAVRLHGEFARTE